VATMASAGANWTEPELEEKGGTAGRDRGTGKQRRLGRAPGRNTERAGKETLARRPWKQGVARRAGSRARKQSTQGRWAGWRSNPGEQGAAAGLEQVHAGDLARPTSRAGGSSTSWASMDGRASQGARLRARPWEKPGTTSTANPLPCSRQKSAFRLIHSGSLRTCHNNEDRQLTGRARVASS
jgi:hypothetical protein